MQGQGVLFGQIAAVFGIVIAGVWGATQWTAAALGYQLRLGSPWFDFFGTPVYHPWRLFEWWFFFDAYAPQVFDTGGRHVLSIEDPVDFIRDTYAVHLVEPPMQLARLTKRFAWIGAKFDVEIAGFPDVEIVGEVFQLNYTLTSQGREIARVDAEYSGMGRAMMGKTSYRVRIQPGLDERQHAAIIGIALAIDMRRAKMRRRSG